MGPRAAALSPHARVHTRDSAHIVGGGGRKGATDEREDGTADRVGTSGQKKQNKPPLPSRCRRRRSRRGSLCPRTRRNDQRRRENKGELIELRARPAVIIS